MQLADSHTVFLMIIHRVCLPKDLSTQRRAEWSIHIMLIRGTTSQLAVSILWVPGRSMRCGNKDSNWLRNDRPSVVYSLVLLDILRSPMLEKVGHGRSLCSELTVSDPACNHMKYGEAVVSAKNLQGQDPSRLGRCIPHEHTLQT